MVGEGMQDAMYISLQGQQKTWVLNIHDQVWTSHLNKIDKEVQTKNTRQFWNKFSVSLSTFFSSCHALKHSSSFRG